jgi:hypothetical protein
MELFNIILVNINIFLSKQRTFRFYFTNFGRFLRGRPAVFIRAEVEIKDILP